MYVEHFDFSNNLLSGLGANQESLAERNKDVVHIGDDHHLCLLQTRLLE